VRCTLATILLLIVPMIAGCDRAAARQNEPIELRFWNGFTGPDGRTMLAIVKRFNDANPDVRVTMQRMDWGQYYNKLFVAGLGGRAPEVFVIHTDTLARFTRANFVRAVDDFTGAGGIDANDFDANVWSAVEHAGKHYAIPLDIHLLGMYYNRTLFKEAGIAHPPTNRAEFLDALRRVRDLRRKDTWGFVFTWQRTNVFTFCRQNGGTIFNADFTAPTLTSNENVEALQFAADLILKDKLVPAPQDFDSWIGFRQGRVAFVFEGIYMLPDLVKQKDLDYAAAPLPVLFKHPAAWANSHNLCVRADLSGEHLAAAKRFITYLSDNSLDWAAGGQIPVRKSLRASPRFQSMAPQREFARQVPFAQYMPTVPFVFEYQSQYDLALDKALRGVAAPRDALQFADEKIQPVIDRYRAAQVAHAESQQ
jgi:multiple sugar transport system substrate-binding protein